MGSHHGCPQAWARGTLLPGKVVKRFGALVMIVKRPVYELFMHYFQTIRRLLGACHHTPIGLRLWPSLGTKPIPLICPRVEKNHAGAHGSHYPV